MINDSENLTMDNDSKIIDLLGGSSEMAKLFNITVGAVSQWRKKGIPQTRLMYLQLARPDVFKKAKKLLKEPEHA